MADGGVTGHKNAINPVLKKNYISISSEKTLHHLKAFSWYELKEI